MNIFYVQLKTFFVLYHCVTYSTQQKNCIKLVKILVGLYKITYVLSILILL